MMVNRDSNDEPRIDWETRDDIPVLTDIVDPPETDKSAPWLPDDPEPSAEPGPASNPDSTEPAESPLDESETTEWATPAQSEPIIEAEPPVEPKPGATATEPSVRFHDDFGVDDIDSPESVQETATAPPDDAAIDEKRLDELHAYLTAELNQAATRIVASAVAGLEAQLADRVAARLREETSDIVSTALADYARDDHQ